MQPFLIPAVLHEISGQPVEQLRVGGGFAVEAEVARRVHDALPKVVLPDAVDEHPGGQWVLSVGQVGGVSDAAAGGRSGGLVYRQCRGLAGLRQDGEFAWLNLFARAVRVAPEMHRAHRHDVRLFGGHAHQALGRFGFAHLGDLRLLFFELTICGVVVFDEKTGDETDRLNHRIKVEQFLLPFGSILAGGEHGLKGLLANFLRNIAQLCRLNCLCQLCSLFLNCGVHLLRAGLDLLGFFSILSGGDIDQSGGRLLPFFQREHRVEDGSETIIVVDADRVILVIMALCAADRQAKRGGADHLYRIGCCLVAVGE